MYSIEERHTLCRIVDYLQREPAQIGFGKIVTVRIILDRLQQISHF